MYAKNYIIGALVLLILDIAWITYFMGPRYQKMVQNIQSVPMKVNVFYAVVAYALMVFGLIWFVMNNVSTEETIGERVRDSIIYGSLFGLMIYGVYNFTAGAVISKWSAKIMVLDIIWGMFVYSISSFIGSLV